MDRAEKNGVELVLPVDVLVAPEFPDLKTKAPANPTTVAADAIPADQEGLDIGPETRKLYASKLADAATVSGTVRWASSSTPTTPRAPRRSPRAWSIPGLHGRRRWRPRRGRPAV